jgi:preprotein translocase subunit YajC
MYAIALAADATTAAAAPTGGALGMFLPMILVFAIFYFLMIRPQQKQQKKHREMLGNIKKGDEVVTASGIHGKIFAIADNLVTLEVSDNVRLRFDKPQVARLK